MAAAKNGAWTGAFCKALAKGRSITGACHDAGISRRAAYVYAENNPEFRQAWLDAEEAATDFIREEVYRRATQGMLVNQTWEVNPETGERVKTGESYKYSDTLLVFEAKKRDHSYRDRIPIDMNVSGQVTHVIDVEELQGHNPATVDASARREAARQLLAGAIEGTATEVE